MRSVNGPIIKICGVTRLEDARHAVEHGATALGFVFWPASPRAIGVDQARDIIAALPASVTAVGVFVNTPAGEIEWIAGRTGIGAVQLHGDEEPAEFASLRRLLLRSVTLDEVAGTAQAWPADTTLLLDASDRVRRGGTGTRIDWPRAAAAARRHRLMLAGGLTPANVEEAIRTVRPLGVDVSSGVEASPGVKDVEKVSLFLANARRAFSSL